MRAISRWNWNPRHQTTPVPLPTHPTLIITTQAPASQTHHFLYIILRLVRQQTITADTRFYGIKINQNVMLPEGNNATSRMHSDTKLAVQFDGKMIKHYDSLKWLIGFVCYLFCLLRVNRLIKFILFRRFAWLIMQIVFSVNAIFVKLEVQHCLLKTSPVLFISYLQTSNINENMVHWRDERKPPFNSFHTTFLHVPRGLRSSSFTRNFLPEFCMILLSCTLDINHARHVLGLERGIRTFLIFLLCNHFVEFYVPRVDDE